MQEELSVPGQQHPREDDPKAEYLDASQNMRQFGNIRFAQLTLFVGVTAGMLTALSRPGLVSSGAARIVLKLAGGLSALVFWMMDERAMQYWHHCRRRAVELEKSLGYRQYTDAPAGRLVSATNALRLLFLCLGCDSGVGPIGLADGALP